VRFIEETGKGIAKRARSGETSQSPTLALCQGTLVVDGPTT
jgi:hypothetical protein